MPLARINSSACADLRNCLRTSLGFHLLMQALGLALFGPLLTWVARRMVLASGEAVISNFDLAGFVLSPTGVLFVLVVASISIGLLLAEFTGQSWIAFHAAARGRVTVLETVAQVLRRFPQLWLLGTRIFLRLLLLALPFLAGLALVWMGLLRGHDINYYLKGHTPEWQRALLLAGALALGYLLVAGWQLTRWLFTVPLLAGGTGARQAVERSNQLTRRRLWQSLRSLLAWWLPMLVLAILAAWAGRLLSDAMLHWAGIEFRRVLPLLALFFVIASVFSLLWSGLLLAGHQFIVTRLWLDAEGRSPAEVIGSLTLAPVEAPQRRIALRALVSLAALLIAGLALGAWQASKLVDDSPVAITAHRGASIATPENTMAAFTAAMDAGADFIELDVQRASDGTVVVLHDGDLMRMAGDPRKVGAVSAPDLAQVDIGRKYAESFTGQTVPTLEQVFDLVQGRLKVNVELKYNVPDPGLAPVVVELLRRKAFVDQVVITSLDAAALAQIKALEPRLKAGLIVTAAVGDVTRTPADFVSLNMARATASLVRRAHSAGKDVHVWTVNTPDAMLTMIERGVDNIITDDPALLVGVLRKRAALTHGERLALRLRVLFDRPPREATDPAAVKSL